MGTKAEDELENLRRLHEQATERTVALAAVIEQAKAIGDLPMDDMTDEQAVTAILERLASADTDAALRERDAEKWDEGYAARNPLRQPMTVVSNPYREGAKTDG